MWDGRNQELYEMREKFVVTIEQEWDERNLEEGSQSNKSRIIWDGRKFCEE